MRSDLIGSSGDVQVLGYILQSLSSKSWPEIIEGRGEVWPLGGLGTPNLQIIVRMDYCSHCLASRQLQILGFPLAPGSG